MIGVNNVTLVGNIGTVSDIMTTTNGSRFVNISVATTELYYSANHEKKNNTQWHNEIVAKNIRILNKKNYSVSEINTDIVDDTSSILNNTDEFTESYKDLDGSRYTIFNENE